MGRRSGPSDGYSLVEILVVLAIIAILSVAGVSMIGNRQASAVRSLLDELEGALTNARQLAVATGRDIAVDDWGNWTAATPLTLAYGDAALADTDLQATANLLLASKPANPAVTYSNSVGVPFHFLNGDVTMIRARIVIVGSGAWPTAMQAISSGKSNQDITTLDPFLVADANGSFNALNTMIKDAGDENAFFAGTATPQRVLTITGRSQRFRATNGKGFIIEVVGTSPGGLALPGSAMGLLVVLDNGASVYKFYNPGIREGDGKWRKI